MSVTCRADDERIEENSDITCGEIVFLTFDIFAAADLIQTGSGARDVLTFDKRFVENSNLADGTIDVGDDGQDARRRHNPVDRDTGQDFNIVSFDLVLFVHLLIVEPSLIKRIHIDRGRRCLVLFVVHEHGDGVYNGARQTSISRDCAGLGDLRY